MPVSLMTVPSCWAAQMMFCKANSPLYHPNVEKQKALRHICSAEAGFQFGN